VKNLFDPSPLANGEGLTGANKGYKIKVLLFFINIILTGKKKEKEKDYGKWCKNRQSTESEKQISENSGGKFSSKANHATQETD